MRRILLTLLVAMGWMGVADCLQAQGPGPYTRPQTGNPYAQPVFSPYLNLLRRGTNPAVNYYGLVRPEIDFRNSLQYTAIVQAKGGLLFVALRKELGDERFFEALRQYYSKNSSRVATPDILRNSFIATSENPRTVRAIFQRWLKEKRGDEDIGAPDLTLIPPRVSKIRALGRVFVWIGKTAARPF